MCLSCSLLFDQVLSCSLPSSLCSTRKLCVCPSWLWGAMGPWAAPRGSTKSVHVRMGSSTCLWPAWVPHATSTVTSASKPSALPTEHLLCLGGLCSADLDLHTWSCLTTLSRVCMWGFERSSNVLLKMFPGNCDLGVDLRHRSPGIRRRC